VCALQNGCERTPIRSTNYGSYYGQIRFKPLRSSQEILNGLNDRRKSFLSSLFSCADKAKIWFSLDTGRTMQKLGVDRDKIIAAMEWCDQQGHLELQLQGFRHLYRINAQDIDRAQLKASIIERFLQHEQQEIERVALMLGYATSDTCLTQKLLAYFGEDIEACGHCGICLGDTAATIQPVSQECCHPETLSSIETLRQQHPAALGTPQLFAILRLYQLGKIIPQLFSQCFLFVGVIDNHAGTYVKTHIR